MTKHSATPVHFPPTIDLLPHSDTNDSSRLGSVLSRCITLSPAPQWVAPTSEDIDPCEVVEPLSPRFEKPRYSTAFLERAHLILCKHGLEVSDIEQSLSDLFYFDAVQQALATSWRRSQSFGEDQLTPGNRPENMTALTARCLGLVPSKSAEPASREWSPVIQRWPAFYDQRPHHKSCFRESDIAAVYTLTFQSIRRLMRGRKR